VRSMHTPSPDHAEFDALCARVEEWEPLPTVTTTPAEQTYETEDHEQIAPVNELILAGLVAPY
jgi:hypothetical protein